MYYVFLLNLFLKPSANPTKWSNTFKQFVGRLSMNCLIVFDHFVGLASKGLTRKLKFDKTHLIIHFWSKFIPKMCCVERRFTNALTLQTHWWSSQTSIIEVFCQTIFAKKFSHRCLTESQKRFCSGLYSIGPKAQLKIFYSKKSWVKVQIPSSSHFRNKDAQLIFTCSMSTIEILERGVKYVQN